METAGCYFDVEQCKASHHRAAADQLALTEAWKQQAGDVNPASPKQLTEFLYHTKGYPTPPVAGTLKAVKRRSADQEPTGEASLDWLWRAAKRPENRALLRCLLDLRKVTKLVQFLAKMPNFVGPNGYLRSSFGTDTGTGRLASRNPNLQNIPSGKNDQYGIRRCFIAPPGQKLLVADYSSLEPRILAHWLIALFGDHTLADALASGDLYGAVACRTWPDRLTGIQPHELKEHPDSEIKKIRDCAKIIVLSSNYGKSVGGLALQLDVDAKTAGKMLNDYFRAYPGIPRFQEWCFHQLRGDGIRTLLGRTRSIAHGTTEGEKGRAQRQATNTVIQGSAADIVMGAMVAQDGIGGTLQQQVHDELIWRVPESFDASPLIAAMEHPFEVDLLIPLPVDWHVVDRWSDAK